MTSGKQFTPDPGVYAEMSQIMQTAKPFSPPSENGQGIAARLTTSPIIEAITPTNDEWAACETVQDTYDLMKRRILAALTPSALSGDAGEVERLRDALERISELSPAAAGARTAQDLFLTVRAIAESALATEAE